MFGGEKLIDKDRKIWGYELKLCFLIVLGLLILVGCGKSGNGTANGVKAEEPIGEVSAYAEETRIGTVEKDGIEVVVPKGALADGVVLKISKSANSQKVSDSVMTLSTIPFDISISGDQRRSDEPILIKMAVDKAIFEDLKEYEGIKAVHYSEATGWTYTTPYEVDPVASTVTFQIYNNPLWGTAELTEAERKEQFIKGKALQVWGESQLEGDIQSLTRDTIESILVNQFNATNKSEIEAIAKAVMKEMKYGNLEYGKLATDLMNKDFKSYTANVATMIGKTFAEAYEADSLSELFGQTGTAAEAAGYLWEGDYSGAGMKLAEAISELSPVYKVGKVAVEVIDIKINNWKNNGIEEAFKAYKEGSNDYILFGYDNDPGDFEAVYDQMRGLARQIEMDAVKRYANAIGEEVSNLSEDQKALAIKRAKDTLKVQFEKRIVQEADIAKQEENQREVLDQLSKWGLLDKGKSWYPEDSSIEQILERMYNQIKRIQQETGRFDLVYKDGDLHDQTRGLDYIGILKEGEMKVSDLAQLISTRYVFGEEEYQKKLKEMGYVKEWELEPGTYVGTLIITDAPILDSAEKALANPESVPEIKDAEGEACEEFDIAEAEIQQQIREAVEQGKSTIGKEVPLTWIVKLSEDKKTLTSTLKIDYAKAFPDMECEEAKDDPYTVEYKDGKLTLTNTLVEDGYTMKTVFKGSVVGEFKLEGTFAATTTEVQYSDYAATETLFSGTWKLGK